MIITCPNCRTKYRIAAASLGEAGKSVRCAGCSHRWFVIPPAELVRPGTLDAASSAPALAPPTLLADEDVGLDSPPLTPPPLTGVRPRGPSSRRWLLGLLVLLVVAAGIVGREEIGAAFPAATPVYRRLGMPMVAGPALEFRDLASTRPKDDSQSALVVAGEIHNPAADARPVPPVRLAVLDDAGMEISARLVEASQATLPPGGSVRFEARLDHLPVTARNLAITFADASTPAAASPPSSTAPSAAAPTSAAPAAAAPTAPPPPAPAAAEAGPPPATH